MTCRRKTKSERELVADINKAFLSFCKSRECGDCEYNKGYVDCKLAYITDLYITNLFNKSAIYASLQFICPS